MRAWSVARTTARSFVLSAIGEPDTLASIHDAWMSAKQSGGSLGLAKLIIRRRVIDLLRKDARQANHCSLAVTIDAIETEKTLGAFHDHVQRNPQAQLELREVIQMVRSALACFATQGGAQQRQAQLLQRYALDDASYSELSVELACSERALLADPSFVRIIDLVANEVVRLWSVPHSVARGFVLSAIGEPETLAGIYSAWSVANQSGDGLGLAKVIVRRRVIDLLRKDARQANHDSLPETPEAGEMERALGAFHGAVERDPRAQLELQQVIQRVRRALACFATQGATQRRQAQLLQSHVLDEGGYKALSVQLACSENALRVRVHKAMFALRRHILECHADLEGLLERDLRT